MINSPSIERAMVYLLRVVQPTGTIESDHVNALPVYVYLWVCFYSDFANWPNKYWHYCGLSPFCFDKAHKVGMAKVIYASIKQDPGL